MFVDYFCMIKKISLVIILALFLCLKLSAQTTAKLWENTSVKADDVTLECFLPENPHEPSTAVIVCPGGSYCWLDYETEGTSVAKWLQGNGIAAFVLKYRVQGIFDYIMHTRYIRKGHKHPQMLQDLQRAIQWVREKSDSLRVNPNMTGAMGFSAGGHLVMSSAVFHKSDFLSLAGVHTHTSLRPDFVAPVYPVVTFSEDVTHKRSRRALLGETGKLKQELRDSLSLEKKIPADCPPVFLVNCIDDPVVKYHNSELLDAALTKKNIPHRYIQYKTGGHGFGASETKGTEESRQWKGAFLEWLRKLRL